MQFGRRYAEKVTDEIREIIRKHIADSGLSQAEVARRIGVQPQNLNRALQERGMIAPIWQRILDYFDLRVIVVRKGEQQAAQDQEAHSKQR